MALYGGMIYTCRKDVVAKEAKECKKAENTGEKEENGGSKHDSSHVSYGTLSTCAKAGVNHSFKGIFSFSKENDSGPAAATGVVISTAESLTESATHAIAALKCAHGAAASTPNGGKTSTICGGQSSPRATPELFATHEVKAMACASAAASTNPDGIGTTVCTLASASTPKKGDSTVTDVTSSICGGAVTENESATVSASTCAAAAIHNSKGARGFSTAAYSTSATSVISHESQSLSSATPANKTGSAVASSPGSPYGEASPGAQPQATATATTPSENVKQPAEDGKGEASKAPDKDKCCFLWPWCWWRSMKQLWKSISGFFSFGGDGSA